MKKIGICVATIEGGVVCHQEIGREAVRRGCPYPEVVTHTPLYEEIGHAIAQGDFSRLAPVLIDSVNRTAAGGADFAIIPSNTMHVVYDEIVAGACIPLISIIDVTADQCAATGCKRVAVLGTGPTRQHALYDVPLADRGIAVVYPRSEQQAEIERLISDEFIRGIFSDDASRYLFDVTEDLRSSCDAVILGCTELPLIMDQNDYAIDLIDTTRVFARHALTAATDY